MFQLRLNPKGPNDTAPGAFLWQVVDIQPGIPGGDDSVRVVVGGGSNDLSQAAEEGTAALLHEIRQPEGPARHEWDCTCGAHLVIEARRSRQNPYSWDSPREIT